MKIRAQSKKVKGKLRWYLVKSYRNDAGESRTKWLVYLGEPPSFQLKKFIARANKHPALEIFFPYSIESIKRYAFNLRKKRKWQRNQRISRLKRRRDLYAAYKAGLPILQRNNPLSKLSHWFWNFEQALKQLEADPNFGPIKNWPKDRKQELRLLLAPTMEIFSQIEAEIFCKNQSKAIQPDVYLGREPTDEETESETVMLQKKLKLLNERETATIRARFGLDDGTKKTLAEIGRKYGVTRERIRQIEKRAIQKLRSG